MMDDSNNSSIEYEYAEEEQDPQFDVNFNDGPSRKEVPGGLGFPNDELELEERIRLMKLKIQDL